MKRDLALSVALLALSALVNVTTRPLGFGRGGEAPRGATAEIAEAPPVRRTALKGMTWGVATAASAIPGTVVVACDGSPALSPDGRRCEPYEGDTACTESRPALCLRRDADDTAPPPGVGADRHGWSRAMLALSRPVAGTSLASATAGDELCRTAFGRGWRMAGFHDGGSGWSLRGRGALDAGTRFWVRIDDQPANCWDPARPLTPASAAASRSPSGSAASPPP